MAAVVVPSLAEAQAPADKATAEALFADGRKLMAAGNYAAACPKLAASQRLDPGVGTILNLADCHEKSGLTATAWAEFHEAVSAARAAGSKDREQLARDRANALEPKLSRLSITIASQSGTVQVTRDGQPVDAAAIGSALPIDPGKHVIEATSAGKRKWSETIEIGSAAAQASMQIPHWPTPHPPGRQRARRHRRWPSIQAARPLRVTRMRSAGSPSALALSGWPVWLSVRCLV